MRSHYIYIFFFFQKPIDNYTNKITNAQNRKIESTSSLLLIFFSLYTHMPMSVTSICLALPIGASNSPISLSRHIFDGNVLFWKAASISDLLSWIDFFFIYMCAQFNGQFPISQLNSSTKIMPKYFFAACKAIFLILVVVFSCSVISIVIRFRAASRSNHISFISFFFGKHIKEMLEIEAICCPSHHTFSLCVCIYSSIELSFLWLVSFYSGRFFLAQNSIIHQ